MKKTILLRSRYNEIHRLERIGESNSHLFLFVPADDYYRVGLKEDKKDNYDFVDPSGGPFIKVGCKLSCINKVVKSITKSKDGITIEFE